MEDETELDYYHHRVSVRVVSRVANRLKTCKISIQSLKYSELEANVQLSTSKTFRRINYFASLQNFFTLFCPGMCVSVCVCVCVCVYVCVCVCVFISFHRKGFSWLKQNNICNARDQASDVVLRKLFSVKYFHRHIIENLSRDLQASNCARVSVKPGQSSRSKRQLLKLSENQR